jgi:hypothetical protein
MISFIAGLMVGGVVAFGVMSCIVVGGMSEKE